MMADNTPTALSAEAYDYPQTAAGANSASGFAFWAPFALVSMAALAIMTQLAAS